MADCWVARAGTIVVYIKLLWQAAFVKVALPLGAAVAKKADIFGMLRMGWLIWSSLEWWDFHYQHISFNPSSLEQNLSFLATEPTSSLIYVLIPRPRGYQQSLTGRPSHTKDGRKHAAFTPYYKRFYLCTIINLCTDLCEI